MDDTEQIDQFYRSVGGKPVFHGGEVTYNFGWRPPEARTVEETSADKKITDKMTNFKLKGKRKTEIGEGEVVGPLLLWHHPMVKEALGYEFNGGWQATGSCVGCAGGNVLFSLICAEVLRLKDPEKIAIPFWPLTWGKSRERGGMHDRGDGSFGSAFAEAARLDGTVMAKADGLPTFTQRSPGWLWWGEDAELDWSQGRKMPKAWLDKAKVHVVKTTSPCRDADDVFDAVSNYYPVTNASMWGMSNPRSAKVVDGMLTAKRSGRWAHQMAILAVTKKGDRKWFFMMNQWGPKTYGQIDPLTGFAGGVWIDEDEVNWIARDEVYAFSSFNGFPTDYLDVGSIV